MEIRHKVPSLYVIIILSALFTMRCTRPTARIVRYGRTSLVAFAIMPSRPVFLFEGVRDAFDPGRHVP